MLPSTPRSYAQDSACYFFRTSHEEEGNVRSTHKPTSVNLNALSQNSHNIFYSNMNSMQRVPFNFLNTSRLEFQNKFQFSSNKKNIFENFHKEDPSKSQPTFLEVKTNE